ncbi:MAG: PAS domain-containing protein [Planctomycetes bacterium]|nr:PAS domain-containing protein [Planctomycetota bacterium]
MPFGPRYRPSRLAPLLLAALFAAGAGPAGAQDPLEALGESWRWRVFDRQEGLGASSVSAVHQDQREFIYAASERGLWRYDLWEWAPVENAQPFDDGEVTLFLESSSGLYALGASSLWKVDATTLKLLHRGGGLHGASNDLGEIFVIDERQLAHLQVRGDSVERIDPGVKLPGGKVLEYEIDARRVHWLLTADGLYSRDMARRAWRGLEERDLEGALAGRVCARLFKVESPAPRDAEAGRLGAAARELWALFQGGPDASPPHVLARLEDGAWVLRAPLEGPPVRAILKDLGRRYYATADDGRLYVSSDGSRWTHVQSPGLGNKVALHAGVVDSSGALWFRVGTGGVAAFDPQSRRWETIPAGTAEPFPNVLSLLETEEGEVWLGMTRGVARWRPGGRSEPHETVQGTRLEKVTGLGEDGLGRVWISSADSFPGLFYFDGESSTWGRVTEGTLAEHPVRRIVRDRVGELWFLSRERRPDGSYVLYRSSLSTAYELQAARVVHGPVNDLARTRDEALWLATDEGLLRGALEEDELRIEQRLTEAEGLLSLQVWAVTEGPDGAVWICYPSSGGVTRVKGGEARSFRESDGLASAEVWSIAAAGQSLWFGTARGLSRFDGECWYSFPVASADFRTSRVWPVAASRREPDSILVGTFGQGALRFRMDDRRRPQFTRRDFPARGMGGDVAFAWDARDHRSVTRPDALLFRSRLDGGPWTRFSNERARELKGLGEGPHVLEVEVRDLAGNRNREDLVHRFVAGEEADWGAVWAAARVAFAVAIGLVLAAVLYRARVRARLRAGRYRGLFEGYPGPAFLVDVGGRVLDWNGAGADLLGLDGAAPEHVLGRPLGLLPPFFAEEVRRALRRLEQGEPVELVYRFAAGGREHVLDLKGFPVRGKGSALAGAALLVEDATDRAEEARALERRRRLESLQRLAARVARDLGDDEVARKLNAFAGRVQAERCSEGAHAGARTAVNDLIEGLLRSRFAPGAGVKVDYRAQPGLWDASVDAGHLEDALAEVLKNAFEALGGKGVVTVRTANLRLEGDPCLASGSYVEVQVHDTGRGIEPSTMDRLFEPFSSTRAEDGALGIGLAAAWGAVRSAGGDLRIESRPGQGTAVRVLLVAVR